MQFVSLYVATGRLLYLCDLNEREKKMKKKKKKKKKKNKKKKNTDKIMIQITKIKYIKNLISNLKIINLVILSQTKTFKIKNNCNNYLNKLAITSSKNQN